MSQASAMSSDQAEGGPGATASQGGKSYAEKVDLNDLDWEDRERVLRLLFSKMNAGVPANVQHIQQQLNNARNAGLGNRSSNVSNEQLVAALEGSFVPAIGYDEE